MQTIITKGRDGWRAETRVQLDATRALKIDTCKDARGVGTRAIVIEPTSTGFRWQPMTDFSERLRDGRGLRCTEGTVRAEHHQALGDIEGLKARALEHYAEKNNAD